MRLWSNGFLCLVGDPNSVRRETDNGWQEQQGVWERGEWGYWGSGN